MLALPQSHSECQHATINLPPLFDLFSYHKASMPRLLYPEINYEGAFFGGGLKTKRSVVCVFALSGPSSSAAVCSS